MAGLVPAIHVFFLVTDSKSWMPGTSPGMTMWREWGVPHAVFAAFNPSRCSTASRITNFWILPVTVIGNSSTNST